MTIARRTRAQLRRDPVLRVRLRSNAGDGRAHRLVVELAVVDEDDLIERSVRTFRFSGTATRRLTVRLPQRALAIIHAKGLASVSITAEQRVGAGTRSTSGLYGADGLVFRR